MNIKKLILMQSFQHTVQNVLPVQIYMPALKALLPLSRDKLYLSVPGLAMEIPEGYAGFVYARSGLSCKRGLAPANKVGVVDADYRGEITVALHNHSDEPKTIEVNERIAQIVIAPFVHVAFDEVDELSDTVRGAGGFGSPEQNKIKA